MVFRAGLRGDCVVHARGMLRDFRKSHAGCCETFGNRTRDVARLSEIARGMLRDFRKYACHSNTETIKQLFYKIIIFL